jgi:hypothetical protein
MAFACAAVLSCGDDDGVAPRVAMRAIGVAEVTFTDLTSANMSATILPVTTVADLERLRGTQGSAGNLDLVQVEVIATGVFTHRPPGGQVTRFFRATFGVRNGAAQTPVFDPTRENLTFVAVRTANTIPDTPVRLFERRDQTAASGAVARLLEPTALAAVDADGNLVTVVPETLRELRSSQMRAMALPSGAEALFPYGFAVLRAPRGSGFDAVVTFAFRIPEQASALDNPATVSVLFLLVDDPNADAS